MGAEVYGDTIPGYNLKSLFKSIVSLQQNLYQVRIDEFLSALQSLGVKKDDISGEQLKIIDFIMRRKHLQACHREGRAMFTNHPGACLTFSMLIN